MELKRKASSPSKRKDIEVQQLCDKCVEDMHLAVYKVERAMRANFMKRIVRDYGDHRILLTPSGKLFYYDLAVDGQASAFLEVDADWFFGKDNTLKVYNSIKRTATQPLHVKINTLRREYEKFKDFNTNINNYIIIEKLMDGTSTMVQCYQMILEYEEQMKTNTFPVLGATADCPHKDAEVLAVYGKQCNNYIFTYYGACAYSRRLVYYAILHNLEMAVKKYRHNADAPIPIQTEHWRHFEQEYEGVAPCTRDGTTTYINVTVKEWELQIHGVKKWFKVSNNQHARKYCALYFQEVIDEVKKLYDDKKFQSEYVDKMVELNEIFKQTADLESEDGEDDGGLSDD